MMVTPDPDNDEYKLDYDHVEIDHDSDEKEIKGHDFNPVEEGSALHLEIHRAMDELGKYAVEIKLISKDGLDKKHLLDFIDEIMRKPTKACLDNGADIIGHIKSFLIVDKEEYIMSSIVDYNKPTNIKDYVKRKKVFDAFLVLHFIVHGIWDDKIRDLTVPVIPELCKKWNIDFKIVADYCDLEKSISHHMPASNE